MFQAIDIQTVKRRLGHAQASTTLNMYGHAMKQLDSGASETLENLLSISENRVKKTQV